jgi:hypothetical protein
MTNPRDHSPRRYFVDSDGHRVLIGLTVEETFEFETLDNRPALDDLDRLAAWDENGVPTTKREQRWLALYTKHDSAWMEWKTKFQDSRLENSGFVNHH